MAILLIPLAPTGRSLKKGCPAFFQEPAGVGLELRRRTALRSPGVEPGRARQRDRQRDRGREVARAIRCASCGAVVTGDEHRICVDGAHRHTRTNPHGLRFIFACFRQAPGCRALGSPTLEWTWFPGYAWQVGVCGACSSHLGWTFGAAGGDSFHGLITDRIASEQ